MTYDTEFICQQLADGMSLQQISDSMGVRKGNLWRHLNHPDRRESYYFALALRGAQHAEQIENLCRKVERGEIDARSADVAIKGRQWISARYHPELFSERLRTQTSVKQEPSLQESFLEVLIASKRRVAKSRLEEIKEDSTRAINGDSSHK